MAKPYRLQARVLLNIEVNRKERKDNRADVRHQDAGA